MINVMNTDKGNELVERILDAAVKLYTEDRATLREVSGFVWKNLQTLSDSIEFRMAGTVLTFQTVIAEFKERALATFIKDFEKV